jgi:hypothetical protein
MRLSLLSPQSEMVIYEAAHAIVNMKRTTSRELAPAVSVLQLFCSSQKPTLRFAAVRTLNKAGLEKNPKTQPSGFFWVFFGFFGFFGVFWFFFSFFGWVFLLPTLQQGGDDPSRRRHRLQSGPRESHHR